MLNLLTSSVQTPKRKKRNRRLEGPIQEQFFQWLEWQHRDIFDLTFAVPNGGRRSIVDAMMLKRGGVKAGIPDVFCLYPARGYVGVMAEFKAGKNKLTKPQEKFMKLSEPLGWRCETWYSCEEAEKFMKWYLKKEP